MTNAFMLMCCRLAAARTRRLSSTGSLPTIWMRAFIRVFSEGMCGRDAHPHITALVEEALVEVKFSPKVAALEQLGRSLGMFEGTKQKLTARLTLEELIGGSMKGTPP